MTDYQYAGRKSLSGKTRKSRFIDMDYVYRQIDSGRTVNAVAKELGVSPRTLQRRHIRYQEEAQLMKTEGKKKWDDPFAGLEG